MEEARKNGRPRLRHSPLVLRQKEAVAGGKCAKTKQEGCGNSLKGMRRSMAARNSRPSEGTTINSPQTKDLGKAHFSSSSSEGFFLRARWNGLEISISVVVPTDFLSLLR